MQSKKKLKTNASQAVVTYDASTRIMITLKNPEGEQLGETLDLPLSTTHEQLQALVNQFQENEEAQPFSFFYELTEIKQSLQDFIKKLENFTTEQTFPITYHKQSLFYVRPITRQSSSLPGHAEPVISASFSPDGRNLASGSGDTTVRFWDLFTETPKYTSQGHKNWVFVISWSPNGKYLASGGNDNDILIWDPETGKKIGTPLKGHKKWITSLAWQPLHLNEESTLLASSSKDNCVIIWSILNQTVLVTLSGHQNCITKVLWGGSDFVYTSSEDTFIKVWDKAGRLKKTLSGHAHWVNSIALHTDYVLRTGCFTEKYLEENITYTPAEMKQRAFDRFSAMAGKNKEERLVSCSDDFTLILWNPKASDKPVTRMTGHSQLVNHVQFSPDGRFIVSASFDKSIKLWDGYNGAYLATFRGHALSVYQIAWSPDSRLFVSASKDSTIKLWDIKTKKLMFDLPGHADEVFAIDWSPNGEKVVSGGKDKMLRIWKN